MNIAINGFGRIGRAVFKIILERAEKDPSLNVVAINDLTDTSNLAYLLRYDTVYGRYHRAVTSDESNLIVGDKKYKVFAEKDAKLLPWKDLAIDVVIESTGVFTKSEEAKAHLTAGSQKVILTAPAKDDGFKTVVLGATSFDFSGLDLISNASCTTNNITPVLKILDDAYGVEKAMMTTIHAYTATQSLVDSPAKSDYRRGRSASQNIVPSSTGAAETTAKVLANFKDIFDGVSLRVPVLCGSISDITAILKKNVTVEDVNAVISQASKEENYKGIVAFTMEQIVSSDVIGTTYSAIIDGNLTKVVSGNFVKVMAWYDNEWGYSNRVVDLLGRL